MRCDRPPNTVVYVVATGGEALFWQWPDRVRRWTGNVDDELLVFFADAVALHEHFTSSADLGIHAATLAAGSHAVILVGRSTAGKTTTALAAVRDGFKLYSDERCIIQNGRVVPFLRALTIREGGRAALLASGADDSITERLRALPEYGDASIAPRVLAGDAAGGPPVPLGAVFVIEGRAARTSIAACAPHALLPALLRSVVSRDARLDAAARVLREVRNAACYLLHLGTPDETVRAMRAVLGEVVAGARCAAR